jgi:hypothetical protein
MPRMPAYITLPESRGQTQDDGWTRLPVLRTART